MDKSSSKKRRRNKLDLCGKKFTTSDLQDLLISNVTIKEFSNICSIDLSFNQLTELHKDIVKFSKLTTLYLYNNQLTRFPEEIGNLSKLTTLYLDNNQLTSIPDEIGNLSNLKILDLSHNELTSLPSEIGNLSNLETLYLSFNQLTSLPDEIENLSNLIEINLYKNQLTRLPEEMGNLLNLNYLNLNWNPDLVYPPYSMVKTFNVAKEVVEYCGTHKDIFTLYGKRKNMWKSLRLMYIAQQDNNCSFTFGILPIELIHVIHLYAISDLYREIKE